VRPQDDFAPDHPLPVFLSREAETFEEPRRSPWLLKTGLVVVAAIVIAGTMTLSLGNPLNIFAEASPTDPPATQPIADQSTPPAAVQNQAAVDAAPTAGSAPPRQEVADTSNAASEGQAETTEPPPGALLKQFQSWAAAQDSGRQAGPGQPVQPGQDPRTQVEPIRPIVQDATTQAEAEQPAQDAAAEPQDNSAAARTVRRHRKGPSVQNARAEIRLTKRARPSVRPDGSARADARAPQDPRAAPDQPAQNAQSPTFLQSIGVNR